MKQSYFLLICLIFKPLYGQNLIRPEGEISPLYSFGQSIRNKGELALQEQLHYHKNSEYGSRVLAITNAYYGLLDRVTLIARIPVILKDRKSRSNQRGLADTRLEAECLLYRDEKESYKYEINGLLGIIVPTATMRQKSRLAQKTVNFFIGWAENLVTTDWYIYAASGAEITTTDKKVKFGNSFVADMGIGKIIFSVPHMYMIIFAELNGIYHGSDKINNIFNFNTGEFFMYAGPTFRLKKDNWWLQGGIQWPVAHRAKGLSEEKLDMRAAISFAYVF